MAGLVYTLGLMCFIFFATYLPNYARCMLVHHLNLLNLDRKHPGARRRKKEVFFLYFAAIEGKFTAKSQVLVPGRFFNLLVPDFSIFYHLMDELLLLYCLCFGDGVRILRTT